MFRYVLFNKPYRVLTQFTDDSGKSTLADFIDIPGIYGAGRLDYDSEGLLLLTDNGQFIHQLMNPKFKVFKTYYVQVEGSPEPEQIERLRRGVELKDGITAPAQVEVIPEPDWLWPRNPPIRERKEIPTTWLSISISEGKNRQVRRMTAAIGHPTLRLVRQSIGGLAVNSLACGEFIEVTEAELCSQLGLKSISHPLSKEVADKARLKRSGPRLHRNQQSRSQNRTGGKTRSGSRRNR
ncbi:pseudouridine synthase [Reinekea marinisedimentorum]|uniref:Pseudouridine synthase n=1 Tax=Reinekea marinisedimentorum TaxID=230495 RepID=A0A4R3IAE5_9GAMM|nr:pseudouridine synthase [Reinekea marinisedimentorum]TCS42477.1 23S rRNA pseudouridine2457 synthase [Reinekea marinisedimentorum]